jgi:endonuclease-3
LVATILSAQCTDERVNRIAPGLFERFPDPRALASAGLGELEEAIRPTGFFRQKARALRACAEAVIERFGGTVPAAIEELTELPGVGRKTASVVAGTAFGLPAVFVDTHVARLARRLGLSSGRTPEKIERDLKALLPSDHWTRFCHQLIHHGRRVCSARKPRCELCPLADLCPRRGVDFARSRRDVRAKSSGSKTPGRALGRRRTISFQNE